MHPHETDIVGVMSPKASGRSRQPVLQACDTVLSDWPGQQVQSDSASI